MATVATLPLTPIVNVTVNVSPQAPPTPTFNQGLIVGTTNVIGSVTGANPRLRKYNTLAQMAADGFQVTDPEYLAAGMYFGQTPAPQILWIGRQDLTALQTVIAHTGDLGTGYAVGDQILVVQTGGSLGLIQVTTIGTSGTVTGLQVIQGSQGTGYALGTSLVTTAVTGTGTGLEVDITAVGETPLQAIEACRIASPDWYLACSLAATDTDHIAIATWAQSQTPQLVYFYTTESASALSGAAGNVFSTIKAALLSRSLGIYSTTQQGLFPNNIYSQAAAMGVAMGLNTGLAGSYFTLALKSLVGIAPEPLSLTQAGVILGNFGNVYLSYANSYQIFQNGQTGSGQRFDQILNLDMVSSDYQFSIMDVLVSTGAVPQDDAGQATLINVVNQANARAAARGFIAPGTWTGVTILNLTAGKALPTGYLSQSAPFSTISQSDRDARKGMPIYVALIQAGAIESITIGVFVQQ
jgi:hypothetical protein